MLFSEKINRIPQPSRARVWSRYRTLCTAFALRVRLRTEDRTPTEDEIEPLRDAAREIDRILVEFGLEPSFFPDSDRFFDRLTAELDAIADSEPTASD